MMERVFEKIAEMPLVAILRGITPEEAIDVSDALVEQGFTFMEVTLNSPDWAETMHLISRRHGQAIALGAGTVLKPQDVTRVRDAGGSVIISPNMNEAVIRETVAEGMVSVPGCYTPTECFDALSYGAHMLKIFPADTLGPKFIKAIRAVLPQDTRICPTGGVTPVNMADFLAAGVYAMGMGSALYSAGKPVAEVRDAAGLFVRTYREQVGWHQHLSGGIP